MVTLACPMSFKSYPMDQQTCRIELQGPNSTEKIWLEKPLAFWFEIPSTKKKFKNG